MDKFKIIGAAGLLVLVAGIYLSVNPDPASSISGQLIGPECTAVCDDKDPCTMDVCKGDGCDFVEIQGCRSQSAVSGPESTEPKTIYIEAKPVAGIGVLDARVEGDKLMVILGLKDEDGKETVDDGHVLFRLVEDGGLGTGDISQSPVVLCMDEFDLGAEDFYQIHYTFTGKKFIAYSWSIPLSKCVEPSGEAVGEVVFSKDGETFKAETVVPGL